MPGRIDRSVSPRFGAWNLVVGGFTAATLGLLLDLPSIGSSGTSVVLGIGIAALIGMGILLVAAGGLQLRRALDRDLKGARRGLGMQSLGWVVFLVGVLGLQISSSIPVLLASVGLIAIACGLAIAGGLLLRAHNLRIGAPRGTGVSYLILGTALIFIGVGVILASKIGYYYVLPDVTSTVFNIIGAAVAACGCVVAAYASVVIRGPRRPIGLQLPEGSPPETRSQVRSQVVPSVR